jgi:3-oxoacyl-[acyl-carrier-protein] synthase-3
MQILNLSSVVPKDAYTTEELIEAFPCSLPDGVKQNILNTGVRRRHLLTAVDSRLSAGNEVTNGGFADLCTRACEEAIRNADLSAKDVDYLVATYDANPLLSPGLSYVLVPRLGLNRFVKHVNAQGVASTALPKALETARNYLAAHPDDRVLVCISGMSSFWFQNQARGLKGVLDIKQINKIRDEAERRMELRKWVAVMQCFLFGDGVSAAVLANEPQRGLTVKGIVEVSNVEPKDYAAGYSRLVAADEPFTFGFWSHLGREIPDLGARYTGLALTQLLGEEKDRAARTARKWAVHTGSERILHRIAEQQGIPPEKLSESHEVLRDYGNLAGASLPFILERIMSRRDLSKGDLVLMVGYGWGFTAAASTLEHAG